MELLLLTLSSDAIAQCITAAVSAFLGAWAAFRLEAHRSDMRERESRLSSLRSALLVLGLQRNFLLNLGTQVLQPHQDSPLRAYLILPITAEPVTLSLDFGSILFLLETGDGELLNEIQLTDQRYRQVLALLSLRSNTHTAMQQHLANMTQPNGLIDVAELRRVVGRANASKLEDTTEHLYEMQAKALSASRDVYGTLDAATRRLYPSAKIFTLSERT